jgi:hypothetical protein
MYANLHALQRPSIILTYPREALVEHVDTQNHRFMEALLYSYLHLPDAEGCQVRKCRENCWSQYLEGHPYVAKAQEPRQNSGPFLSSHSSLHKSIEGKEVR